MGVTEDMIPGLVVHSMTDPSNATTPRLPAQEEWKPMLLSMLLGAHQRIRVLEDRLESLERQLKDAGVIND